MAKHMGERHFSTDIPELVRALHQASDGNQRRDFGKANRNSTARLTYSSQPAVAVFEPRLA